MIHPSHKSRLAVYFIPSLVDFNFRSVYSMSKRRNIANSKLFLVELS